MSSRSVTTAAVYQRSGDTKRGGHEQNVDGWPWTESCCKFTWCRTHWYHGEDGGGDLITC